MGHYGSVVALWAVAAVVWVLALWPSSTDAQADRQRTDYCLVAAGLSSDAAGPYRDVDVYRLYRAAVGGERREMVASLLACGPRPSPEQMESLIDMAWDLRHYGIRRLLKWYRNQWEDEAEGSQG